MSLMPAGVRSKVEQLVIPLQDLGFSHEIFCSPEGWAGQTWLLACNTKKAGGRLVILSAPPVGDLGVVLNTGFSEIKKIHAEKNFFGNLKIQLHKVSDEPPFSFEISSLQKDVWSEIVKDIEKLWGKQFEWAEEESHFHLAEDVIFNSEIQMNAANPVIESLRAETSFASTMAGLQALNTQVAGNPIQISFENAQEGSSFSLLDSPPPDSLPGAIPETTPKKAYPEKGKRFGKKTETSSQTKGGSGRETSAQGPTVAKGSLKCKKCGQFNKPDYSYCLGCGAPIQGSGQQKARNTMFGSSIQGASISEKDLEAPSLLAGCISQFFLIVLFCFGIFFLLSLFGH